MANLLQRLDYRIALSWQYAAATVMLVAYPILSKFNICDNGADRDLTLKIHIEQDRGSYDLLLDHQDRNLKNTKLLRLL